MGNAERISAAVIGVTSLFGGRGSAVAAVLGVIVIQAISSGLTLMNLESSIRYMVTGAVVLIAVSLDAVAAFCGVWAVPSSVSGVTYANSP